MARTLYRVEHKDDGKGPFNSGKIKWTTAYKEWRDLACILPTPRDDGHCLNHYERCACPSVDALKEWFGHGTHILSRHGFVVRVLEVKRCKIGESKLQAFYNPKSARVVETHSLRKFLKAHA